MPHDKSPHLNVLASWGISKKFSQMSSAPFVLGNNVIAADRQQPLDAHFEVGKARPMLTVPLSDSFGPLKGFGTDATSLKQSLVMPSSNAFISCVLSALICSRISASLCARSDM